MATNSQSIAAIYLESAARSTHNDNFYPLFCLLILIDKSMSKSSRIGSIEGQGVPKQIENISYKRHIGGRIIC